MSNVKKMTISRYDESITEPPYLTIQLDTLSIDEPKNDYLGEEFCERLRRGCIAKGYQFRFYTLSEDPNYDYEVIVY